MSRRIIETLHDTVLKVRLVFFDIAHELAYEGPCRFVKGMELERQFDEMIINEASAICITAFMMENCSANPRGRALQCY